MFKPKKKKHFSSFEESIFKMKERFLYKYQNKQLSIYIWIIEEHKLPLVINSP